MLLSGGRKDSKDVDIRWDKSNVVAICYERAETVISACDIYLDWD
jgi:hypothetical protein